MSAQLQHIYPQLYIYVPIPLLTLISWQSLEWRSLNVLCGPLPAYIKNVQNFITILTLKTYIYN